MTPDKNFRLKGTYKVMIATMKGTKEDKNHFKKMMIGAQLAEEAADRASKKSKQDPSRSSPGRHTKEGVAVD
jgi:hypothetical protein